jgi:general secretion pathway protein C
MSNPALRQLQSLWTLPRLIGAAEMLLAVCLALVLADLIRTWPPQGRSNGQTGQHGATTGTAGAAPPAPPSAAARAMFGNAPEAAAFSGPIAVAQLNLTLKGIVAERDSARQVAVIADAAGVEQVYAVGDAIADATVAWIEPHRVVLARNGRHEALTWPDEEQMARFRTVAPAVSAPAITAPMQALPELLRQAQTEAVLDGGQPAGLQLVWVDPESVINDVGMREGDVIRAINGVAVRELADFGRAYRQVQNEPAIRIGVRRDTEELSFDVPLR